MSVNDNATPIDLGGDEDKNLIEIPDDSQMEEEDIPMLPLFSYQGDVYEVPANPSAGLALLFLKIQREEGADSAAHAMLEEMLGDEGYDVLMNHPKLPHEKLEEIMSRVVDLVMDGQSGGKGSGKKSSRPSRRGRKRSRG